MKIFSPLFFDQRSSFLPWDWSSVWGTTDRGRETNFDRWREPSAGSSSNVPEQVYEIPIQYEGAFQEPLYENNYYDYDFSDDGSDSDYDFYPDPYSYNWNNNGTRVRRKRRRSNSSNPKIIFSKDSLLNEKPIDIDSEKESKISRSDRRFSDGKQSKTKTEDSLSSGSCQRVLRSQTKELEKSINDTSSYEVYNYLKALLLSTDRQIDAIKGDGNCFFRGLSKVVYGAQGFYDEMRQAVVDVIEKHPKRFEQFADDPINKHIAKMRLDKTWATQTEIYAAATLLQREIFILSPDQRKSDSYRWLLFAPQFRYSSDIECCRCYITLCHTHGNHYDRIASLQGKCNCDLPPPEMSGVKGTVDLTTDENEIV